MPSFDIISEINIQEADNAINQARKEIEGRYDFKGSKSEIQWDKREIFLVAEDDYKIETIKNILQTKFLRRGIDIKALSYDKVVEAGGRLLKQKISIVQGIDKEKAKSVIQVIKDSKLKVQTQIVDDKVRVMSKSIDELQSTMSLVKNSQFDIPLQFNNMRS